MSLPVKRSIFFPGSFLADMPDIYRLADQSANQQHRFPFTGIGKRCRVRYPVLMDRDFSLRALRQAGDYPFQRGAFRIMYPEIQVRR
jgi:hypothetical protein